MVARGEVSEVTLDFYGTSGVLVQAGSPLTAITDFANNFSYSDDIQGVDTLRLLLTPNITGTITIDNYTPVKLIVDGQTHFNGYIESFDSQATIDCKCVSNAKLLARTRACDTFSGAQLTSVAGSLITKYTPFSIAGIQTSDKTISSFKATDTLLDAVEKVSKTLAWPWYVTPSSVFYLEPEGTTSSGKTLTVGSNCERLGKWNYDISRVVNKWTVEGKTYDIKVVEEDAASINSYGLHENPATYIDKTLTTREDARQLAKSLLEQYKNPFIKGTLVTELLSPDIRAGRTIGVVDDVAGVSGTFIVNEVTIDYGKSKHRTTLAVGNTNLRTKDWQKDVDRRIKELEESFQPGSPIVNVINSETVIDAQGDYRVRTRDIGSTFILDHPKNGTLGTGSGLLGWCGSSWHTAQDWV